MRNSWLGVAAVALVILALGALAAEIEDQPFAYERTERLARIDFELRQVAAEQARLDAERVGLERERLCTFRARSTKQMRACSLLR